MASCDSDTIKRCEISIFGCYYCCFGTLQHFKQVKLMTLEKNDLNVPVSVLGQLWNHIKQLWICVSMVMLVLVVIVGWSGWASPCVYLQWLIGVWGWGGGAVTLWTLTPVWSFIPPFVPLFSPISNLNLSKCHTDCSPHPYLLHRHTHTHTHTQTHTHTIPT